MQVLKKLMQQKMLTIQNQLPIFSFHFPRQLHKSSQIKLVPTTIHGRSKNMWTTTDPVIEMGWNKIRIKFNLRKRRKRIKMKKATKKRKMPPNSKHPKTKILRSHSKSRNQLGLRHPLSTNVQAPLLEVMAQIQVKGIKSSRKKQINKMIISKSKHQSRLPTSTLHGKWS